MIGWVRHLPAGILVVTYSVGVVGLSQPQWRGLFLTLTPVQLLLTTALALATQRAQVPRPAQALWAAAIAGAGWLLEVVGVHTGVLFGHYTYGSPFSVQVLSVPLLIGINWLLLVACSSALALRLSTQPTVATLLAASIMTALDWLMEPVAQALGFWYWQDGLIPLQNYIMWWVASAMLCGLYIRFLRPTNTLAPWVLVCQFSFFLLLRLILLRELALPN